MEKQSEASLFPVALYFFSFTKIELLPSVLHHKQAHLPSARIMHVMACNRLDLQYQNKEDTAFPCQDRYSSMCILCTFFVPLNEVRSTHQSFKRQLWEVITWLNRDLLAAFRSLSVQVCKTHDIRNSIFKNIQDIEGHGEYTKSTEDLSLSTETDALCTEVGLVRCRQTWAVCPHWARGVSYKLMDTLGLLNRNTSEPEPLQSLLAASSHTSTAGSNSLFQ